MADTDSTTTDVTNTNVIATGTQTEANHTYDDSGTSLTDNYLWVMLAVAAIGAITAFIVICALNIFSHKIQLKMIKNVYNSIRVICVLQLLAICLLMVWTKNLVNYAFMIAEFVVAVFSIFTREHCAFRWISIVGQLLLVIMNMALMTLANEELYCYENDSCSLEYEVEILKVLYAQYFIAYYLEILCLLLIAYLIAALGWCATRRFPRNLNLEKYNIERPQKVSTVYDFFPHAAVYEI